MPTYKYKPENIKLLSYHMNCNPDYLFGHAKIVGKLVNRELLTYQDYQNACSRQGISCYNEETFNKYMELA